MAWTYGQTYTQVNDYSVKDGLTSGDAEKIILGSDIDDELLGIANALNLKLDASSVSSQAEAEGGSDTESVMTPRGVQYYADANAGMVGDIQALTDPGEDTVLGWDDSASAAIGFTLGDGLSHADTELNVADAIAGDGLVIASSVLAVGAGSGITVNANDVQLTDAAAAAGNPIDVTSGAITIDLTALDNIEGNALAATDEFLVDDGGTPKAITYAAAGCIVPTAVSSTANKTFTSSEMNQIWRYNAATDVLWDLDTGVGVQGNWLVFIQEGAGQIDLSGGTATINFISSHTGTRAQNSVIVGWNVGGDEWYFTGDSAVVA